MSTTGKVEITEGAKNEAQLAYLHDSYDCRGAWSAILSHFQSWPDTLQYIPVGRQRLAKKGSKSVPSPAPQIKEALQEPSSSLYQGNSCLCN